MLRYYSTRSDSMELIALFRRMYASRLFPEPCVYPALIKAAGNSGISLHSHLIKVGGNHLGKYITNALIRAYGKYGPIESARQLFDEMTDRSVADWNALLVGYWNWGHDEEAKRLFHLMPTKNVISCTTMVTGFSRMKDLESARYYFDRISEKNVVSWNAMISGYAQNGFSEESLSLFREMVSLGFVPDETTSVAVISSCSSYGDQSLVDSAVDLLNGNGICLNPFVKTALLNFYAKRGQLELARSIFDEMKLTRNSTVTWNSMISAYLRAGKLNEAAQLFSAMPEKDVVSWNTMIAGYDQHGESMLAVELFDEMLEKFVIPDEVTVVSVLSACGHLGAQEVGNRVAEFIAAKDMRLSLSGYNSLIFMYSRCGNMIEAHKIFSEMKTRDVVSYNALITGYASQGNAVEALKVMEKMREEGVEADRISYAGVLTACSHSGMIEEGRRIFQSIEDPDMDHYGCIIDLVGRLGRVDEAKRMIEEMAMDGQHGGIYGSLLNASRLHGRLDVGEFAALKLLEVEPENSGNYVLLSNMYACAGRWEEVGGVREAMKARGMVKVRGWSCVEMGG
ncbi:hypothetical protein M569_06214, partial [Genlisea aurea]